MFGRCWPCMDLWYGFVCMNMDLMLYYGWNGVLLWIYVMNVVYLACDIIACDYICWKWKKTGKKRKKISQICRWPAIGKHGESGPAYHRFSDGRGLWQTDHNFADGQGHRKKNSENSFQNKLKTTPTTVAIGKQRLLPMATWSQPSASAPSAWRRGGWCGRFADGARGHRQLFCRWHDDFFADGWLPMAAPLCRRQPFCRWGKVVCRWLHAIGKQSRSGSA